MHSYIQITKLNDFIFCPKSLYFHEVYNQFSAQNYHTTYQTKGKLNHITIDTKTYSTSSFILQSLPVFSDKYMLAGKIDIYDKKSKSLIERKTKITTIYDGYKYQLYAQYFCLLEMGYEVQSLFLHSLEDNKRYKIDLPNKEEIAKFEQLVNKIWNYDILKDKDETNPQKCAKCIYNNLCTYANFTRS